MASGPPASIDQLTETIFRRGTWRGRGTLVWRQGKRKRGLSLRCDEWSRFTRRTMSWLIVKILDELTTSLTFNIVELKEEEEKKGNHWPFSLWMHDLFSFVSLSGCIINTVVDSMAVDHISFLDLSLFSMVNELNRYGVMPRRSELDEETYCRTDCLTTLFTGQEKWRIQVTWE